MYKDRITLDRAKQLQSTGDIIIVDASPESLAPLGTEGKTWKENFKILQAKSRDISPDKLLSFYSAKYTIEVIDDSQKDLGIYSWRYLSGVENGQVAKKVQDNIEYIYVLVNAGYPSLVKIGMTTKEVNSRVTGLNASSTVDEWVAKFALPVSKGNAIKVEQAVHRHFSSLRVSSDMGNKREFFTLDPLTAFDKIREVGAMFQVGNPITY